MIKSAIILTIAAFAFCAACTKGPGPGGRAKISGKVWGVNLDKTMTVIKDSGYIADEKVFISYGDNSSVGDNVTSSFDGSFEFDYLRPGNYKVWMLSKRLYGINKVDSVVIKDVTIASKNDDQNIGNLRIFVNKN